nr:BFH_HP1_G0048800.mRNA.1.CDS.1 [Saccharomyces cerevisiae]
MTKTSGKSSISAITKVVEKEDFGVWILLTEPRGFLRGEQFAVCLALIVDGVVQLGCIDAPT